ncbi:MAG TPA: hypothetical protein VHO49_01975 [Anaerolineales bacterium]|nr:hypothetical protein [Anaerolineales bacterium]
MATMTELTQAAAFLIVIKECTAAVEALHGRMDRVEVEHRSIAW